MGGGGSIYIYILDKLQPGDMDFEVMFVEDWALWMIIPACGHASH